MILPDPATTIDNEIAQFDKQESSVEDTVRSLLIAFPYNEEFAHVLLKVIVISQLYSARVLNIDAAPLARHIASIPRLDHMLAEGLPEVVALIHDCDTTRIKYYSFATKFCSWHNQDAYPLWDYNVDEALWAYGNKGRKGGFAQFKRKELLDYARLVEIVKEFRDFYGLNLSPKNMDKFLWRVGASLLQDRKTVPAVAP
jgi:hypothetical protein